MRKVIGIGETILDIIFRNNKPVDAVPGGSTFNTLISLGRLDVKTALITELGNDRVGKYIKEFMEQNNIDTNYIDTYNPKDGKTPISLAFLDNDNNASYTFYHQYPQQRFDVACPDIKENDIVIFGSYFSINPILRKQIVELIEAAKIRKAIIYYDLNFRKAHAHEALMLMPSVIENFEYAHLLRGSSEDFATLCNMNDAERIYTDKVKFYCPNFIYTDADKGVELFCRAGHRHFDVPTINTVSTIGAGDTFNAGILWGFIRHNVTRDNIDNLSLETWQSIIEYAIDFAAEVCQSNENYLSLAYTKQYLSK